MDKPIGAYMKEFEDLGIEKSKIEMEKYSNKIA